MSIGPMGLDSKNGETGHPKGCDRHAYPSTGISWIEPSSHNKDKWVVTCPGCGQTWASDVEVGGRARGRYKNHSCPAPELPVPNGRHAKEKRTNKPILRFGQIRKFLMELHINEKTAPITDAKEVANEFGVSKHKARMKLEEYEGDGLLHKRDLSDGNGWYLADFNWSAQS